ncbi:hypothetical protein N478_15275 [Pseudoalteromonas luteoviolacea S4060-1]|uniref:Membrane-associated sensor domain-containing protein n=2 Tax=Pseudoalteromonas luteoviolacea TaxID=43657 RepID=A0A162CIM3_9GAMM|nr:hypothetical protein N478_15275 [Pseudoalteromonas luteoviolacea S4060-1]
MASLMNIFFYVLAINKNLQTLSCSVILATSYGVSDLSLSTQFHSSDFGILLAYDVITIICLLIARQILFKREKVQPVIIYCCLGLMINSALFLAMFVDSHLLGNYQPWGLWYFYSTTVNVVDLIMVGVVILNRDLLGIQLITKKLGRDKAAA